MSTDIQRHHSNTRMSKIVKHNGLIFLCGQTSGGTMIDDIQGQTREVLNRVDTLLAEVGSSRERMLSATIHLKSMGDFAAMNACWEQWLMGAEPPARTTVEARLALESLLVEITVIAAQ